jgi:hypothetical protein
MYLPDPSPAAAAPPFPPPSRLAARLGGLMGRGWRQGWMPEPVLDPERLVAYAIRAEGARDFGPDHWQEPFEQLVRSLRDEAALNPLGRTLAQGQLVKALRERLRVHALWRRHPAIADWPLASPIVVLGSMRSGTTRVQRLLAQDPRLAHTRLYESLNPVPERGLDLRGVKAAAGVRFLHRLNPALDAIHPTGAWAPDEEFGLLAPAFSGAHFYSQWRVPGFTRWWEGADARPVYQEFRHLLQTIAWARRERERPWVLKVPQFMEELPAFLQAFPGARLLCLGRDAVAVVGSSASLVWQQHRIQSDRADPREVGRTWLGKTARRVGMAADTRRRRRDVAQLELDYDAVTRDWRREMARVYAWLGLNLPADIEGRMARYVDNARGHRGHRYELGQFGLSEAEVRRALPEGA